MSKWYRTGTVNVTNGSTAVVGVTTGWLNQVKQGDVWFGPDGKSYEIAVDPTTNTGLTLETAYQGTTQTGQAYAIARFSDGWRPTAQLSLRIANFLDSQTDIYSGTGAPSNGLGGDGSAYFRQDLPYLYFKAGDAWGTPINLTGPPGPAGADYVATSTTSLALGTGTKVFTAQTGKAYATGARVRAASNAGPSNYMEGVVASYSGATLTVTIDRTGGSGTFNDWNISLAGDVGSQGVVGPGYGGTSTTSLAVATGTKIFTTQAGLGYVVGQRARASSAANSANFMEGRVASYVGTSLTLTVDIIGGSGTFADWAIGLAGERGVQGVQGIQGIQGNAGASFAATSASSNAIGTGNKTFATQTGLAYVVGSRARAIDAADTANFVEGRVTAYAAGSMTIAVDKTGGSGTITSWNISLAGEQGNQGDASTVPGPAGPNYNSTSASSLTVGTGTKVFAVASGLPYVAGQRLRAASAGDLAMFMSGIVASYATTVLTLTVDLIGATAGTAADWIIALSGEKGDVGAAGGFAGLANTKGNWPLGDGSQYGALGVGADGAIPQANAAATYGVSWAAVSAVLAGSDHPVVDVASAATCDIGAAASNYVRITGTTLITSLGTAANRLRFVLFAAALTLTYNGTSLILPGLANIATAAGDTAIFMSDASGNFRCLNYTRQTGEPLNLCGTIVSKTAAYTVANSDKSKILALGGSAFFPVTLRQASAYDPSFGVILRNEDFGAAARAKTVLLQKSASTTSLAIATGSKVFTVASGLNFNVGDRVRAWSDADFTAWMSGEVASYSGTTLTLTIDTTNGSGTKTDWDIGEERLLWPEQTVTLRSVNAAWAPDPYWQRWKAPFNTTINIDAVNGKDSNDGLATGSGGALKTCKRTVRRVVKDHIDMSGFSVFPTTCLRIKLADNASAGVPTTPYDLIHMAYTPVGGEGRNAVLFEGNTTTPSNVVVADSSGVNFGIYGHVNVQLRGIQLGQTGGGAPIAQTLMQVADGANVRIRDNVVFGRSSGFQINAQNSGKIFADDNFSVVGNAQRLLRSENQGQIDVAGRTITFANSPAYSTQTIGAYEQSLVKVDGVTWTNGGTVTGPKFFARYNSVILTGTGDGTSIPGNSAGSTGSGARCE